MRFVAALAVALTLGTGAAAQPEPPPGEVPPPAPPPPTDPPPTAGGLEAPPPIDPAQQKPPTPTEQKLNEAKEKDSERGQSWFYVDAEGGFQHVGLETFQVDDTSLSAGLVETTSSGGYVGVGLGAHILVFTIGPRFRVGFFPDWQMFSIGGEIGMRFPIGIVEPFFNLGAGYTALGNFSGGISDVSDHVDIRGADARVMAGVDFFVTKIFAIGVGASWEFLALTRPGIDPTTLGDQGQSLDEQQRLAIAAEGSGFGSAFNIGARLSLHF
jgi:hypothetical protein